MFILSNGKCSQFVLLIREPILNLNDEAFLTGAVGNGPGAVS